MTATSVLFDFLREAVILAEDYPALEKEIYSRQTLSLIRGVLPLEWDKEFVKSVCGLDPSYEMSFQKLMNFAELKKNEINFSLKTRNEDKGGQIKNKSSQFSERQSGQRSFGRAHYQGRKHDCKYSKHCKIDWDILGCVELTVKQKFKKGKPSAKKTTSVKDVEKSSLSRNQTHLKNLHLPTSVNGLDPGMLPGAMPR